MAVYQSSDKKSVFASVDFDEGTGTAFFLVKSEVDVDKAKELAAAAGQTFMAQSYVKGHTIIITHSLDKKEDVLEKLAASGGGQFEPEKKEKPTFLEFLRKNGWKIRGGSSVVGQSMTLFSAFNAVSKTDADAGRLNPKFDPAIGAFAVLNLTANFVNYIFGGQKEEDVNGLDKFDDIIADEVNRYLPEGQKKVSSDDVRKLSYMNAQELTEHNKERSPAGIMRRNSVRLGEVGLRTLGSICMMLNYKKVGAGLSELFKGNLKQAFLTAKVADKNTFLAGCGMVSGKIMGLFAKTYDPNDPPTTYIEEIRQKVLWITSSFTEMVAQSSVAVDRARNKRLVLGGKATADYTGVVGNVLLTVPPYPTRLVLPYGEKVLDVNEVQARLLDELPKIPQDKVPEVAARVTARMVEHMGDKSPSFAELYKDILKKLDKFHNINVLPCKPAPQPEENTHFVDKIFPKTADTTKNNAPKMGAIKDIINRDSSPVGTAVQMG